MDKPYFFFRDINCDENYQNGLSYFACGIVEEDIRANGLPSESGKDFVVSFIDPWGNPHLRYLRATEEIILIEASEEDYEFLRASIAGSSNDG